MFPSSLDARNLVFGKNNPLKIGKQFNPTRWKVAAACCITLLLLCFCFGAATAAAAEGLEIEWENTMGNYQIDHGYAAVETADGCYVVAGETFSRSIVMYGTGGYDAYLAKLGPSGNMLWQKTYGGYKDDSAVSVQLTGDGGFIVAGTSESYAEGKDTQLYLVKTLDSGEMEWQGVFGGSGKEAGVCAVQTTDGGYIVIGDTNSFGAGGYDVYLVKTDASGKIEWEKTYGGGQDDHGLCVRQAADGGYILAGRTESFDARGYDLYLVKIDPSGALEWETTVGGDGWEKPESLEITNDGGFITTGRTSSFDNGNFNLHLVKADALGNIEWEQAFGGEGWGVGKTVQQTVDGGFLAAGFTDSPEEETMGLYLLKTDANGKKIWDKTLVGEKFIDDRFSIRGTADGGYIIAGWWEERLENRQWRNEGVQIYVTKIKTQLDAGSAPAVKQQEENSEQDVQVGSLALETSMLMQNNRVLVPFRPIAEALGAEVQWEQETQTVTMTAGENTIKLAIGSDKASVNGDPVPIDAPAAVYNEQTYVPLRFVSDALGAQVNWEHETKTVSIVTEP